MIKHDLLGKRLRVVDAKNQSLVGIEGEVVDESKNTIKVRTVDGEKTLLKEQVTIEVEGTVVEGQLITQRPEKRTKLKIRKWQRKKPKE